MNRICHDDNYKWIILFTNALAILATLPGHSSSVSMFIEYWIKDLNISRINIGIIWLISCIISGICVTFFGKIIVKYGVRKTSLIIYPLYILSLYSMYFTTNIYNFSISLCLIRILGPEIIISITYVSNSQWFDKMGKVFSILSILETIHMLSPLFFLFLINTIGWRLGFLFLSVLFNILLLPGYIFIKNKKNEELTDDIQDNGGNHISYKKVIKKPLFWCMVLNGSLLSLFAQGFGINIIDFIKINYGTVNVLNYIFVAITIGVSMSNVFIGLIYDKCSLKNNIKILCFFEVLFALILYKILYFYNIYLITLTFFIYGLSFGLVSISYGILYPKMFGIKEIGAIYSLHIGIVLISGGLGPLLFSLSVYYTNNYNLIVIIIAILKLLLIPIYIKSEVEEIE